MLDLSNTDKYGLLIVFITIFTRVFIVSIAWNYGMFIQELKKTFVDSSYSEIEWIAGLAQGLGSVIAPVYLLVFKRLGLSISFFLGLLFCCLSLLASSFVNSPHLLFFTYSLPFGIGSSMIMIAGTYLTGIYFPSNNRLHVFATVFISLGFPLGFLILSPLTQYMIEHHSWQYTKRVYALITVSIMFVCCPFFNQKYAQCSNDDIEIEATLEQEEPAESTHNLKLFASSFWYIGLIFLSLAINSIMINLNGYFKTTDLKNHNVSDLLMLIGLTDMFYRLLLATFGRLFKRHLTLFYILAGIIGSIIMSKCYLVKSYNVDVIMCTLIAFCQAVYMSLMYPVGIEINDARHIQKTYTFNVLISGIGIIIGPLISGFLLDMYNMNYNKIFIMSASCFAISAFFFSAAKFTIIYINKKIKYQLF